MPSYILTTTLSRPPSCSTGLTAPATPPLPATTPATPHHTLACQPRDQQIQTTRVPSTTRFQSSARYLQSRLTSPTLRSPSCHRHHVPCSGTRRYPKAQGTSNIFCTLTRPARTLPQNPSMAKHSAPNLSPRPEHPIILRLLLPLILATPAQGTTPTEAGPLTRPTTLSHARMATASRPATRM